MNRIILIIWVVLLFNSCAKSVNSDVEVYSNDFEANSLTHISNGTISSYNGSHVLGNYNNQEFGLTLNDLPEHNLVDITFDLYIHDSWEGNQSFQDNLNGPDIWQMKVDNKSYIYTTFANFNCLAGNFCPPQSYPADYPTASNNPKSGASRTDLPGFCSEVDNPNGTTLYKIHKRVDHSNKTLLIQCLDKLMQKNAADPKCDESWSVDNIKVRVINLK